MRQSAKKLSNKMKQARDDLEDDLKETRDVVKELNDFLSGKDSFGAEGRWMSGSLSDPLRRLIDEMKVPLVSQEIFKINT